VFPAQLRHCTDRLFSLVYFRLHHPVPAALPLPTGKKPRCAHQPASRQRKMEAAAVRRGVGRSLGLVDRREKKTEEDEEAAGGGILPPDSRCAPKTIRRVAACDFLLLCALRGHRKLNNRVATSAGRGRATYRRGLHEAFCGTQYDLQDTVSTFSPHQTPNSALGPGLTTIKPG